MSSLRQPATSSSISVMRPPKPPSWRDFVASDVHNNKSQSSTTTAPATAAAAAIIASNNYYYHHHDTNATTPIPNTNNNTNNLACRVLETKSATHLHNIVHDLPRPSITSLTSAAVSGAATFATANSKSTRAAAGGRQRPRAKIHRTRSEHGIITDDLPQDSLPPILRVSTATTTTTTRNNSPAATATDVIYPNPSVSKPDIDSFNGNPVCLEINRRCQSWLASIEACEPLDEVSYSTSTPIPSPVATAVAEEKKQMYRYDKSDFGGAFPIPLHNQYGEDVDVEIPDEMFVWRGGGGGGGERRSSSPLSGVSQEDTFSHSATHESRTPRKSEKKGSGGKVTTFSLPSSGSHKDAFIPTENKQFLPSSTGKSKPRVEFTNLQTTTTANDEVSESLKQNNKKNSSKVCCDNMCITFNCYRRKYAQSDT